MPYKCVVSLKQICLFLTQVGNFTKCQQIGIFLTLTFEATVNRNSSQNYQDFHTHIMHNRLQIDIQMNKTQKKSIPRLLPWYRFSGIDFGIDFLVQMVQIFHSGVANSHLVVFIVLNKSVLFHMSCSKLSPRATFSPVHLKLKVCNLAKGQQSVFFCGTCYSTVVTQH